ncbi:MAG: 50S ribosomal protein L17 [Sedimentisphaerales bacterium]|nr:50S ribosomal protein L17 [Sedimentisphaerales bacterium]
MRHRVAGRQLGRTSEHRLAMRRNMVASLFEHETIATTVQKAKEVKPFAEKLITLAKKGTLPARRRAISLLGNRDIVAHEDGKRVRKGTVIGKLFSEIGPRYLDRPGGYTRIIHRSLRRLGDNGQLVLLQLIAKDEGPKKKAKTTARKRSASKRKTAPGQGARPEEIAEAQESADLEQTTESEDTLRAEQVDESAESKRPDQAEHASDKEAGKTPDASGQAEEKG